MMRLDKIKASMRKPRAIPEVDKDMLSTGSTLLNMACSGDTDGGIPKGSYVLFVGDSISGKTFVALTMLAEAAISKAFDDYRLIYDGPEGGALMDIRKYFGDGVADRLEPPEVGKDKMPVYSDTAQDFYIHVWDAIKVGKPFIMLLDSQDCLSSKEEVKKFDEMVRSVRKKKSGEDNGEKEKGSYGDAKAKIHSANLRRVIGPLQRMKSILIIINQTRDSFSMFESSTYSGGRALKFYATLQLWSKSVGKIEKTIKGKKRSLGIQCKVQVKKNRVTGRDRSVVVPIYHSYGVDDVGSMVDYLVEEKYWKKVEGGVLVTGLGPKFKTGRESLIRKIEDEGLEQDVRKLVKLCWDEIEEACAVNRKKRY